MPVFPEVQAAPGKPTAGQLMDAIGARLQSIAGLRVSDFVPQSVTPPAAVVQFPRTIEYDQTLAGGSALYEIPVLVVVGAVSDRASRDALVPYLDQDGPSPVKTALEGDLGLGVSAVITRVEGVGGYTFSGTEYLGATIILEVMT